jgi:molybdenum cofactor biosynthesis enzyme MoaA
MRTQTVSVTRHCNQRCGFCDTVDPNAVDRTRADVLAEIESVASRGAAEVVFTGGEPTMRDDLLDLVRGARERGVTRVVVETNATRIATVDQARAMRDAGVTRVRVSVVTANPARHVELVGRGTHPGQVVRGLQACLAAGLDVEVRLPIAAGLPRAAGRLLGMKQAVPGLASFVLAPIGAGEATLRKGAAASTAQVIEEITESYDAAEKADVRLSLSPDHAVPPCVAEFPLRVRRLLAPLFRDEDGEANRACDACATCALATRCRHSAQQVRRAAGNDRPRPIPDAKPYLRPGRNPGSRLRVLDDRDVEQFFHVDYEYGVEVHEPTSRIGIIYRCNQVCTFCELADMDVKLTRETIRNALERARARGSQRVIITGGEPTLSPDLVDHIAYARTLGFSRIEIQTNAVLLDRPGFAKSLRDAGLTHAQISLHGPDGAISDALTAALGTHARTLRGVDALLEQGVQCLLNHLVFRDNCHLLESFVEMVHARWGTYREQLVIQFHSARNEFPDRDEALRHVARYSEYAPALRRAIDRGRELGYRLHDLQDPTGIPALCVLGADEKYLGPILAQTEKPRLHAWESEWMTRVSACDSCDAAHACMGVPRYYVSLHGESEFAPIRRRAISEERRS